MKLIERNDYLDKVINVIGTPDSDNLPPPKEVGTSSEKRLNLYC